MKECNCGGKYLIVKDNKSTDVPYSVFENEDGYVKLMARFENIETAKQYIEMLKNQEEFK